MSAVAGRPVGDSQMLTRRLRLAVICLVLAFVTTLGAWSRFEPTLLVPAYLFVLAAWVVMRLAIEMGAFSTNVIVRERCTKWTSFLPWGFRILTAFGIIATAIVGVAVWRARLFGAPPPIGRTVEAAFAEGGWGMWLILVVFVATLAVAIERAMYLWLSGINMPKVLAVLRTQITTGDLDAAIKVCAAHQAPVTRIIRAGLLVAKQSEREIDKAMDLATRNELSRLDKRTGQIAMLGNLATLSGLLGTIIGLITSFAGVVGVDPSQKAEMLSKGISEAMNCTAFGLGAGILGLAVYALVNERTHAVAGRIDANRREVEGLLLAQPQGT
jgi:biopolymer transport protein ExbB/TolQ